MKTVHNFERILLQFDDVTLEAKCGIERLTKTDLSRVVHKSSGAGPNCNKTGRVYLNLSTPKLVPALLATSKFLPLHSIHPMPSRSAVDRLHKFENQRRTIFMWGWGWRWESGKTERKTFSPACMRKVQEDWVEWAGQSLSWAPHHHSTFKPCKPCNHVNHHQSISKGFLTTTNLHV